MLQNGMKTFVTPESAAQTWLLVNGKHYAPAFVYEQLNTYTHTCPIGAINKDHISIT
jgi:hypothetical protein